LVGKYLAVRLLGAGGFGTVFLALQHAMLSKKAALKILHVQEDPHVLESLIKKFKAEAEALAVISHPNVVQLLEYGTQDDAPYMVMEFVEGSRTLKSEVQERVLHGQGFTVHEVQSLLEQTAHGLEAAHSKGIIHRDIKPDNLMLQTVAGNPLLVRIVDFGLAKFTEAGTRTSKAMGTPTYMAPEQLRQEGLGPWTDLYAVGVVAFELLTGRLPFPGRTTQEVLAKKIDPAYDPLSQVQDLQLPEPVRSFLKRALARDPGNRYRNAGEFRTGLAQACDVLAGTGRQEPTSDLVALLDPKALQEVSQEKKRLEEKEKRLEQERARLEAERKAIDEEKRKLAAERESTERPGMTARIDLGGEAIERNASGTSPEPSPVVLARLRTGALIGLGAIALIAAAILVLNNHGQPGQGEVVARTAEDASPEGPSAQRLDSDAANTTAPIADKDYVNPDSVTAGLPEITQAEASGATAQPVPVEPVLLRATVPKPEPPKPGPSTAKRPAPEPTNSEGLVQESSMSGLDLYKLALKAKMKGNIEEFQKLAQLSTDKGFTVAHKALGMNYQTKADYKKAAHHFRKYLELAPNAPDAEVVKRLVEQLDPTTAPSKPVQVEAVRPKNDADTILAQLDKDKTSGNAMAEKLTALQKKKSMDAMRSKVQFCFVFSRNPNGIKSVQVRLTIAGTGKVTSVTVVTPGLADTAEGECVAGVLKKASFDAFSAEFDFVHYTYLVD
jgi:serine/threonine protein kinase